MATSKDTCRLAVGFGLSFFLHATLLGVLLLQPSGTGRSDVSEVALTSLRITLSLQSEENDSIVAENVRTSSELLPETTLPPIDKDKVQEPKGADLPGDHGPSKRYYGNLEVDVRATPIEPQPMLIPQHAYLTRVRGSVRIRAFISEHGLIDSLEVVAANPPGVFEEAVIAALAETRFYPARRFGRAVASVKEINITIDPYETISQP